MGIVGTGLHIVFPQGQGVRPETRGRSRRRETRSLARRVKHRAHRGVAEGNLPQHRGLRQLPLRHQPGFGGLNLRQKRNRSRSTQQQADSSDLLSTSSGQGHPRGSRQVPED